MLLDQRNFERASLIASFPILLSLQFYIILLGSYFMTVEVTIKLMQDQLQKWANMWNIVENIMTVALVCHGGDEYFDKSSNVFLKPSGETDRDQS